MVEECLKLENRKLFPVGTRRGVDGYRKTPTQLQRPRDTAYEQRGEKQSICACRSTNSVVSLNVSWIDVRHVRIGHSKIVHTSVSFQEICLKLGQIIRIILFGNPASSKFQRKHNLAEN